MDEEGYLNQLKSIMDFGNVRDDRTKTGVKSMFGLHNRYNLKNGFPLFTTKKVNFKLIAEELLWFVRGSTNVRELQEKGVHIWDANTNKIAQKKEGLGNYDEWEAGPIYGFQWRHFGANYVGKHGVSYTGIDQLKACIENIKKDPLSRRHLVVSWNPSDLGKMVLPPCHIMFQFYVNAGELSCQMYQRSADMAVGVPFNVASYSLLTCIIAKMTDLRAGEFIHVIGDGHIYLPHIEGVKKQLIKEPLIPPKLNILNKYDNIEDYNIDDFELINYVHHPAIKFDMFV
jgi:thymidylate synthase